MSFAELADEYRLALKAAGYSGNGLPLFSTDIPSWASSREAFQTLAQLPAAHEICAVIESFADVSGLRDVEDFSVSCLPRTNVSGSDMIRASATSIGGVEVLVVLLDRQSGRISNIIVWAMGDEDTAWLNEFPAVSQAPSHLDGGGIEVQVPGASIAEAISQPAFGAMVSRRLARMREKMRRYRRDDWHNRWLWAFVSRAVAEPAMATEDEETWDVTSEDAFRLVRQRTSQLNFRKKLLESQPVECAICGIREVQILEAAHLIPHARGGRASHDNGRLVVRKSSSRLRRGPL